MKMSYTPKPDLQILKSYLIQDNNDFITFKYEYGPEKFIIPNTVGFSLKKIQITRDIYFAINNYFYEKNVQLNGNYKILVTDKYVNFYNLDKKYKL
jgi:hypothetical protein